ncbi:endosomal trafficking protein RME-8, putative [Leishmania tarentolae]|uniref:Endosomal trafficking protein RME-8, putative n=1 Tax=Leishmania tarentolae TaxID=5689 RepID=A0A640KM81_LEITA|nr:endosomal trafficking protein RME-8, putative [Leishmania tarentolae]
MTTRINSVVSSSSDPSSAPLDHRSFTSCYTVTKHSWRGKYTRIFCVGPHGIATCDVRSLTKLTNYWPYTSNVRSIFADGVGNGEFLLVTQNYGSRAEELRFSCVTDAERAQLLTDVNRYRLLFDCNYRASLAVQVYDAMKYTINETLRSCTLRVTATGVEQLCRIREKTSDNQLADGGAPGEFEKVGEYLFCNIRGITTISDRPASVVIAYGTVMKMHLYDVANAKTLIDSICKNAAEYIGLPPYREMKVLQQSVFDAERLGIRRDALEAVGEFSVLKQSPKQRDGAVRRLLSTTQIAIVERDPVTYNPTSAHFLHSIFALVRCEDDDQRFLILFKDSPVIKSYQSPVRDTILAHVLTACYSAGDGNVCVMARPLLRRNRLSSLATPVTEEVESLLLKGLVEGRLAGAPVAVGTAMSTEEGVRADLMAALELFNANVPRTGLTWSENRDGLFSENREKLIFNAVEAVLKHFTWVSPSGSDAREGKGSSSGGKLDAVNQQLIVEQFQALGRLSVSRVGFSSIALVPSLFKSVGVYSVQALRLNNLAISFAVIEFLNTLMTPFHNHYEIELESMNKNRLLSAEGFIRSLMEVLRDHIPNESASLLVLELLFFFEFALCPPYSHTTDPVHFKRILGDLVDILGRQLFKLLGRTCDIIRYTAGQIIRVVMEEGDKTQFERMQELALSEGGILTQFNTAVFSSNRKLRDLARRLIAYWAHCNVPTQDILRRMVPLTLLSFLQSPEPAPASEQELEERKKVTQMTAAYRESKTGWFKKSFNPRDVTLEANRGAGNGSTATVSSSATLSASADGGRVRYRVRNVNVTPTINWSMFFYQAKLDHLRPDLIWNHTTRAELKAAVQTELDAFRQCSDMRREKLIAWNYAEFEVVYHSLDSELKIGQHYPRLLFEDANPVIARPREFFNDMYHRFLLVQDTKSKLECLHGLALLYTHYAEEIGEFNDIPFLLRMLEKTTDPMMRDRLLLLLARLLKARHNIKLFLDHDGLAPLMELVTVAHLHVDRPQLKSISNTIEYAGSLKEMQGREKEWHYTQKGTKAGPVSFSELKELYKSGEVAATSKVWAQGMPGWREFSEVAQLRWGILSADLPSILTLTEVTCTVLDVFLLLCEHYPSVNDEGAIMQPQPKVKRLLSSPSALPHLVQLLLTFDSGVCTRVHKLLLSLMEANPLLGRFFLTGVFFFSCLYTASDVLPMCRLLAATHHRQSFQYTGAMNDLVRDSILAPLLPPAMVCYLTHHGPEAFADVLLGEYDNPEAIWSPCMRQYLAAKVAAHVADFTPRLLGNNTVVYQYCPIVGVQYESLQKELFCSQYYLRHFCDELRFPNWPVRDTVRFLTDVLQRWREELNKQPSSLTREKCYEILELQPQSSKQDMRKAYYQLAARYHPDKNPNGREEFEQIQRAYECLAADSVESSEPSPYNISLLLKAQTILYKRCGATLRQYKYAGFALLLRLIESEFRSPDALHKDIILLDPATELCYFIVRNAPLNADELQEENGIHLLAEIATYCFDFITPNSHDTDVHVRIATHCMLTFSISARFPDCRLKMLREKQIPYLTAKGIAYYQAPELSRACTQACASESRSEKMQSELIHYGSIWHLLQPLFFYDASLDQAGVSLDEGHHRQLFTNRAAIYALHAICALCGISRLRPIALDSTVECAAQDGGSASAGDSETTEVTTGADAQTKRHAGVYELLQRLLTPFILYSMERQQESEAELLMLLNCNSETPYFLWNNSCRAELGELLQMNSKRFREAAFGATDLPSLTTSLSGFTYSLHASEVVVGGVFLRLFISQPNYPIQNPVGFFMALLRFLHDTETSAASGKEDDTVTLQAPSSSVNRIALREAPLLASQSLRLLSSGYTETLAAAASTQMKSLVALLTPSSTAGTAGSATAETEEDMRGAVFAEIAQALSNFLSSDTCLQALSKVETAMTAVVLLLARILGGGDEAHGASGLSSEEPDAVLALIRLMLAHRSLVQQSLDRGLYIFLLSLYATSPTEKVREECCRCLAKGYEDRLVGPQLFIRSSKYLPAAFLEMMKDNVKQACGMLDTWQENPELLWTKYHREELMEKLQASRREIVAALSTDALACWKPLDSVSSAMGETKTNLYRRSSHGDGADSDLRRLQVGGVYVALYVQQPGWAVRHPKEFLVSLLERFVEEASKATSSTLALSSDAAATPDMDMLELLTRAGEILLSTSPGLRDYMTSLGYGSKVDRQLSPKTADHAINEAVVRCSLRWLREMSRSVACVESMSSTSNVLPSLVHIIQQYPALAMEALQTLEGFLSNATPRSRVLEYAVRDHIPETLLKYLEEGLPDSVSAAADASAATIRAALVKVIKALLAVPNDMHTLHIQTLLDKSLVWAKYKNQSHDMFLMQTHFGGYLTAGSSPHPGATAATLSLTTPKTTEVRTPLEPPPLEDHSGAPPSL